MDSIRLRRALLIIVCLIILKVVEFFITAPELDKIAETHNLYMKLPRVNHPRCDACRAVAGLFDVAFRAEDSKIEHLGLELSTEEVETIVKTVCSKEMFRKAELVEYDGYERIAFPNLETWQGIGRPSLHNLHGDGVQWPVRMQTHCQYMADLMKGIEIYDLWLRTGHGDPLEWIEFMCEGDGPFGDCLENKVLQEVWPGEVCENKDKDKCDKTVTIASQQQL